MGETGVEPDATLGRAVEETPDLVHRIQRRIQAVLGVQRRDVASAPADIEDRSEREPLRTGIGRRPYVSDVITVEVNGLPRPEVGRARMLERRRRGHADEGQGGSRMHDIAAVTAAVAAHET